MPGLQPLVPRGGWGCGVRGMACGWRAAPPAACLVCSRGWQSVEATYVREVEGSSRADAGARGDLVRWASCGRALHGAQGRKGGEARRLCGQCCTCRIF
eukprot:83665-Chlamydomonas_euryale.AAC.3